MIYQTAELIAAIELMASEGPGAYFRDRYFGNDPLFSTNENIYFDVIDSAKRLAPYVSPLVEGKIMEHRGYATRVFQPPYVKPKGVIDPNQHMFSRLAGEQLAGSLTPAQRRERKIAETLQEHEDAITHREEIQAMEGMRLGQVTVTGEGYGTRVLSFGRNALHTVVLSGAARWNQSTGTPIADIEAWAQRVFDNSGASPREVYFGVGAWEAFRARLSADQLKVLFDSLRASRSRAELGPVLPDYVKSVGGWGEFDFFTVSNQFQDEDGVAFPLLPTNEIVMAAQAIEGRMTYAAIRDARAGMAAVRAFPKTWYEEDPPVEFAMTQSAPLAVMLRPDASLGARVY